MSFPILCMGTTHGGGAGDGSVATNGGRNFMPRGSLRVCHDALNPRCVKH
ncbi:hypothetical protein MNBD_ALPHA12-2154 [hydrothermal vent metagenome]|uniref:Uncharacterized protein n=1 Tax=hydrothermal vent metagenome TaxID=652676 RepID=A0A3B0TP71_9ZZZZ